MSKPKVVKKKAVKKKVISKKKAVIAPKKKKIFKKRTKLTKEQKELKKLGYKVFKEEDGKIYMVRKSSKVTSAIVINEDDSLTVLNGYKIDKLLKEENV